MCFFKSFSKTCQIAIEEPLIQESYSMTEYLFQGEFNPDENLLFILMPTCFHFQLFVYKVNKRDLVTPVVMSGENA